MIDEPQDGDEFVTCCECGKVVDKDQAEPAELIETGETVWICDRCYEIQEYEADWLSRDLFDA